MLKSRPRNLQEPNGGIMKLTVKKGHIFRK